MPGWFVGILRTRDYVIRRRERTLFPKLVADDQKFLIYYLASIVSVASRLDSDWMHVSDFILSVGTEQQKVYWTALSGVMVRCVAC